LENNCQETAGIQRYFSLTHLIMWQ